MFGIVDRYSIFCSMSPLLRKYVFRFQEILVKQQALEAYNETVRLFEEQIRLHDSYQKEAAPHEEQK